MSELSGSWPQLAWRLRLFAPRLNQPLLVCARPPLSNLKNSSLPLNATAQRYARRSPTSGGEC
jgi:hypothetical protein